MENQHILVVLELLLTINEYNHKVRSVHPIKNLVLHNINNNNVSNSDKTLKKIFVDNKSNT